MTFLLIELPPALVRVDENRFPNQDESYIYEHLLHYCGLFEPLPALEVRVEAGGPIVTTGHQYLRIARELGRPFIRAVVDPSSDQQAIARLLANRNVRRLDVQAINAVDWAKPVVEDWQVFFFEHPLSAKDKKRFEQEVVGFIETLADRYPELYKGPAVSEVRYDDKEKLAEFRARLPVGDESWFSSYYRAVKKFSEECVRLISFQGRRFE